MRKKIWIAIGLVLLCSFLILATTIRIKMGKIPSEKDLLAINQQTASEIYSSDGQILGRIFAENRTNVSFDEIPKNFQDALIATEDARFFEHSGIDYRSLGRVLIKSILLQDESAGGGSTLSQQLAKNLYPRKKGGVLNLVGAKFREALVASKLESLYTKEELLTLYLNTVSFGEDVYGIEAASIRYFNKKPIQLEVQESAVLVGILKATTAYNPRLYPEQAKTRRNTVLSQMAKYDYLDQERLDSLTAMPIELQYRRLTNERGTAPYFKAKIRPMIDSLIATLEKPDGEPYNIETDGLKITTTIDSRLQFYADSAVAQHLTYLQDLFDKHWSYSKPWNENPNILEYGVTHSEAYKLLKAKKLSQQEIESAMAKKRPQTIYTIAGPVDTLMSAKDSIQHYLMLLQTGVLSMEPSTGHIKAWVGGLDFEYFQYDHVTSKRQVGSTFKPIVYTTALENGIEPCDYFKNTQETYEEYEDWSPGNADGDYEGFYSLKGALTHSVNTVSAQVILETGIQKVIDMAHSMGIRQELPEVPSLALGTADLSLLEMVNAYATIANKGIRMDPVYILKIENAAGKVLWEYEPKIGVDVMSEQTAQLITNFMQSVVTNGTGRSLGSRYGLTNEIAGKTGTTQSYADGWFMGFTPEIVTGVWVGADNPGVHFRTGDYGQGARMALPVWALMMQQALKDPDFASWQYATFDPLDDDLLASIDCPLYTEKMTLFDRLFGVKDRTEDEDNKEDKKPFFKKLKGIFSKKKDKD
ncbi:penicillin-binding protein 1A [Marinoscillum pacificum]|uniref:penicillin-binding protein 1A n=1 Tax=Marinoscillum pacificum TaxID=392723 RepID=UPI00215843E2|nr:transglycosylase domain-containing protein [Marinoscillum pacificum]